MTVHPPRWTTRQREAMAATSAPQDPEVLRARLMRYAQVLADAAPRQEFLDLELGRLLVGTLTSLLDQPAYRAGDTRDWVIQAAHYILNPHDIADDLTALDGLDDDAEVLLSLLDALDRADLAMPIRRHLKR
jgi:hypothetical protein